MTCLPDFVFDLLTSPTIDMTKIVFQVFLLIFYFFICPFYFFYRNGCIFTKK